MPVDLDCKEEEEESSGTLKERLSETARRRTRPPLDMSDAPNPSSNSTFEQNQAPEGVGTDRRNNPLSIHAIPCRLPSRHETEQGIFPTELYTAILRMLLEPLATSHALVAPVTGTVIGQFR